MPSAADGARSDVTYSTGVGLFPWGAYLLAVAVLTFIAINRHLRGKELLRQESARSESSEAEVQAAEKSIRYKTHEALQHSKRNTKRCAQILLMVICIDVPFFRGMPLNAYFRPWGQLLTTTAALMSMLTLLGCFGMLMLRRYKRDMDKLLDGLHDEQ